MPHPDQALIRQRAEEVIRGEDVLRFLAVNQHCVNERMPEIHRMEPADAEAYLAAVTHACNTATITVTWNDTEGEPA